MRKKFSYSRTTQVEAGAHDDIEIEWIQPRERFLEVQGLADEQVRVSVGHEVVETDEEFDFLERFLSSHAVGDYAMDAVTLHGFLTAGACQKFCV